LLSDEAVWQPAASLAAGSDESDRPSAIITVGRASKRKYEMKKLAAALLTAMAMAVAPVAIAPVAHADVCAGAHGRHVAAGGCTDIAGDVATVAIAGATDPYWAGQEPCYSAEGVPYYTPDGDPC
jgi:hypothetical protein